jgi:hypothetical protein
MTVTRVVALAFALVMIAPAAEAAGAAGAADHNVTKGRAHRSRAVIIQLEGKARRHQTRPRWYDHQPLHGARPEFTRGEEQATR